MGYACAEDRLFQLDYDRRRACGRWAEIAGVGAFSASNQLVQQNDGAGAQARGNEKAGT